MCLVIQMLMQTDERSISISYYTISQPIYRFDSYKGSLIHHSFVDQLLHHQFYLLVILIVCLLTIVPV